MKKPLLLTAFCLFSGSLYASPNCDRLAKIADDNGAIYGTKYSYTVKGPQGYRSYFHTAPSEQCKIKNVFIIPKDSVIAYQEFKNENELWLYVMYIGKDGVDTEGWVKAKDFKMSGRISPN
ncbi:hypothetical protein E0H86_09895 [Acinetobacter sp. ANC 4635]|uniref:hypothetical protein n=1 Tax=Acinetobacter sp. ANC 4635 TaxID=2529846 RepID=UPI00103CDF8A|nr:hypothetical protein [Acinetobacter sp. ANC 4635]TCB30074.1 hypothetical protein E0H86_09895 [Acinetobacter sp. ANC 4635]